MTLTEMIRISMGQILCNYEIENERNNTNTTIELELKLIGLVQDIVKLMEEITEQNKQKTEVIELPMPYVLTMLDALQAIKKHKLYNLMGYDEEEEWKIDTVIEEFLNPIAMSENVNDIEIALYD